MNPQSPTAQLLLAAIRLRARRLALWMEHLWQTGQSSPDQGLAIGPSEVARLLAADAAQRAEASFFAAGEAAEIAAQATQAAETLQADAGFSTICQTFALTEAEADFLALLAAVEIDPGLGRVVAYLHDDGRLTQPTPWLAARLSGAEPVPFAAPNLRRWLLAAPVEGAVPDRLITPWQADPVVARAIASLAWHDPAIADATVRIKPADASALPLLHPEAQAQLDRLADLRDAELVGPPGIGRQILAAQVAAGLHAPLLASDLEALPETGLPLGQALVRTLRQAAMTGAIAYFKNADAVREADWKRLATFGVPYLRGVRHPTGFAIPIAFAPLSIAARHSLWQSLTEAEPPPALAARRFTPAEISRAAAGAPLAPRTRRGDHALLTLLPTPYEWDDLILSADIAAQLRAFEDQVRLRWTVYEDWGMARLTHLGQGISALFGGPSGTGKTMAAQVIAKSLGLELLRVDLAGVVNKYIGETEKKLREVFDLCEDSGALLFFDEADALFGNRTQVKDAHDRFANIEIDYLLQRIERFDGVAILATNRKQDLDPAFVRRLRFVVEFLPPRPDERLILWRRALPPETPNGEIITQDVDFSYLAERLIMTGAEIKNTVLAAAFLARAEERPIGMRHLFTAAQREMAKQGQRLRVPFQEASA